MLLCMPRPTGWNAAGELLSLYRGQLEDLLAADGRSNLTASPLRTSNLTPSGKPKRKRAAKQHPGSEFDDYSSDDVEASVGPVRSGRGTNRAAASPGPPDHGEVGMPATAARSPSRRVRTPPASLRQDAVDSGAEPPGGDGAVASADPAAWTFVQCENVDCMKWRKVAARSVDSNGPWVCAMNPDRRCGPADRRPLEGYGQGPRLRGVHLCPLTYPRDTRRTRHVPQGIRYARLELQTGHAYQ